jgi:hypothetical protein
MGKTIIQVPVEKKLRDEVEKEALKQGFSSIQDVVRLFFRQFVDKQVAVSFVEPAVVLSKKNAARYDRMTKDFEAGRNISPEFSSVDELMAELNS